MTLKVSANDEKQIYHGFKVAKRSRIVVIYKIAATEKTYGLNRSWRVEFHLLRGGQDKRLHRAATHLDKGREDEGRAKRSEPRRPVGRRKEKDFYGEFDPGSG